MKRLRNQESIDLVCSVCSKSYLYRRRDRYHTRTMCGKCVHFNQMLKCKIKCVMYKGGCCELCGYSKSLRSLTFHHLFDKNFTFADTEYKNFEKLKPELDKCVLLCANCHGEKHDPYIDAWLAFRAEGQASMP